MRAFGAIVLVLGCLLAAFLLFERAPTTSQAVSRNAPASSTASEPADLRTAQPMEARSEAAIETDMPAVVAQPAALATIAGVVRVNGRLPEEPITLVLTGSKESPSEQRTAVDADGRFTFAGLAAGFRGQIQIPRRYRVTVPEGSTRFIAVEAPRDGFVIELVRKPGLTGRFVSQEGSEPVEPKRVGASITWGDGSQMFSGADLEPGGRFFVAVSEDKEIARVSVKARADHGLQGAFEFAREDIPEDLDLGELVLTPGMHARLVVLDPERRAIAGARVIAPGSQQTTDSDGRATLEGLPADALLHVLARGFDPVTLPAPVSEVPVEIVLDRANRLTLTVLDSAGEPEPGVRVRVMSAEHAFLQSDSGPDPLLVPQVARDGVRGGVSSRYGPFVLFVTDERGMVEMQSLRPLLPLSLRVEDELGSVVHEEPIAPMRAQEERELTIRLTGEPSELAGRVEDQHAQPLAGAQLMLSGEDHGIGRTTGPDGRFSFVGIRATQVDLRVELRGYVTARFPDLSVAGATSLRIVLDPGHDVRVSVVDPRGERIAAGSLFARLPDGREWRAENVEDGFRWLRDLPERELEVRLQLAGSQYLQPLGAYAEELEIRVPLLGRLEVTFKPRPELPEERLGLRLRSLDDENVEQFLILLPGRTDPTLFDAVLPGAYKLCFATWRKEGTTSILVPLSTPVQLKVEPGETQRVNL